MEIAAMFRQTVGDLAAGYAELRTRLVDWYLDHLLSLARPTVMSPDQNIASTTPNAGLVYDEVFYTHSPASWSDL